MLFSELERLAQIAHESGNKALVEFVKERAEAGDVGVMFHDGLKKKIRRILKEG
jgi:hypothetical protein